MHDVIRPVFLEMFVLHVAIWNFRTSWFDKKSQMNFISSYVWWNPRLDIHHTSFEKKIH